MTAEGTLRAWGGSSYGGSGAPTQSGHVALYANAYSFAALSADGTVHVWGAGSPNYLLFAVYCLLLLPAAYYLLLTPYY